MVGRATAACHQVEISISRGGDRRSTNCYQFPRNFCFTGSHSLSTIRSALSRHRPHLRPLHVRDNYTAGTGPIDESSRDQRSARSYISRLINVCPYQVDRYRPRDRTPTASAAREYPQKSARTKADGFTRDFHESYRDGVATMGCRS